MSGTHERFTNRKTFNDSKSFRGHERSQERNSTRNCEFNGTGFSTNFGFKRKPNYSSAGYEEDYPSMPKRSRHEPTSTTETRDLKQDPPIEKPLELSLDELSTGCKKKLKIKRTVCDERARLTHEEKVVEIDVKPGWKAGTRITFTKEGDKNPGRIPADITFVIRDKPHALFSRDSDNNLIHKANISLKSALLGLSYCVQGLGGTRHTVNIKDIIHPGFTKRYPGEGLPLPKTPSRRGDLIVTFDIEFPKFLSWDQRRMLSECLPG